MNDYAALAQRVGLIVDDVRGCLVLSRDGLVLAAFPEEEEEHLKPLWLRFVQTGEVRKAFVEFGDQIWAFVHRGPYAAFVVAGTGVRPGVLLDQLEQVLLAAEASRATWEPLKLSDAHAAPSGKPRAPLHPSGERVAPGEPVAVVAEAPPKEKKARSDKEPGREPVASEAPLPTMAASPDVPPATGSAPPADTTSTPGSGAALDPASGRPPDPSGGPAEGVRQKLPGGDDEAGEIDRVLLAKEFSGLLQMDSDGDEASG